EDTDAADSFKFSDLRSRFEGAKNGTNPLKPTTSQEGGNGGGGSSTRGNVPRPSSSNGSTNGAGGGGDVPRPPSRDGLTNGRGGGNGSLPVNSNGATNGAAGGGRGNESRPLPPSKPQPLQLQLPSLLRPPALPTKPVHPFGSRPGPSTAGASEGREERRDSTEGSILPRKKPPLAPKPKHLLADYKPAPSTPERNESRTSDKAESLESVRVRAKRIADQLYAQAERRMSVRIGENGSSVPGTPINLSAPSLPLPTMHEEGNDEEEEVRVEIENGRTRHDSDSDDAYADSEVDSEESRSTADTASHQGFGRLSQRYASSISGYGSADLHSAIMRELASKGIAPGSNGSSLPHSIGKMRTESTRQQARSVSGSALHASSPKSDISSLASSSVHSFPENGSGSGIAAMSACSGPSLLQEAADICVPDYATGDEKEDGRLKKLHYAALEFLTVQRMFVEYLNMIINVYPSYLEKYGEHVGRTIIAPPTASTTVHHGEGFHVVQRVQKHLIPYYEFHKMLLKDIGEMMDKWSSHSPCMSTIFARTAPFLKQCVPFLKEKSKIADEMTRLLKEDVDFAAATLSFEQHVFNRGVGAVIQQLDQVHQNFMRYKLLMQSYIKFLPEESEEWERTDSVIRTLEKINMEVNQSMGLPNSDQLMRLATLFQGQFDVFKPGRRLIRQENVDKQTRKETQPRILVLFSDTLWLCRVMSSLGSAGMFDMARSYAIPIEDVRVEITNHFDYDCYMEILSKRKSAGLWFKCASARDEWRKLIEKAKNEMIALRERLQGARKRSSRTLPAVVPDDPTVGELQRTDSGLHCNGTAAAAAAVPTRSAPPPPPLARPHSIIVAEGGGGGNESRRMSQDTHDDEDDFARSHEEEEEEEEMVTPVVGLDDSINGSFVNERLRSSEPRKGPRHKVSARASSSHSASPFFEIGEQPVWINDQMSTKCLMDGCENDFNLFHRRHHCRNCGWLICKKCRGYAPVQRLRFEREIVCPECYDDIEAAYMAGTLFPSNFLLEMEKGVYWLAVTKGKKGKERIERVNPAALFSPPHNRGLKRQQNIDQRMRQGDTVYGKVFLKTKRGESEMHAHLADDGLVLAFYKAAFDKHPTEQHVIYGFSLMEEDAVTESGRVLSGKRFILRHTNQHGTESQRVISFRVVSDTAARMWSAALQKALRNENLDDDEDD
ncbi:hypothetical protein PENTCL1PPCAC_19146, partial [Pristionchus entomophagus]